MRMKIRVISQQPPGGRCKLYADYADTLARQLGAATETVYSQTRAAHGNGFPSLWLDGVAVQPEDGLILMPSDIAAALAGIVQGIISALVTTVFTSTEALTETLNQLEGQGFEVPPEFYDVYTTPGFAIATALMSICFAFFIAAIMGAIGGAIYGATQRTEPPAPTYAPYGQEPPAAPLEQEPPASPDEPEPPEPPEPYE